MVVVESWSAFKQMLTDQNESDQKRRYRLIELRDNYMEVISLSAHTRNQYERDIINQVRTQHGGIGALREQIVALGAVIATRDHIIKDYRFQGVDL